MTSRWKSMGKETSINLFFFVVLKKMSNMFALSIFFHMSTSFEWECFGVFTGTWRISIGDRSLYLASLAWTGLLFRAEIVRLFYVLHFLPVFFQYLISFQCLHSKEPTLAASSFQQDRAADSGIHHIEAPRADKP